MVWGLREEKKKQKKNKEVFNIKSKRVKKGMINLFVLRKIFKPVLK